MRAEKYLEKLSKYGFEIITDLNEVKKYLKKGKLGSTKISDEKLKKRFLYEGTIETDYNGYYLTFTEYAKVILYELLDKYQIKRFRNLRQDKRTDAGYYAKAGEYYGDYVYVDIKSCHYTILKRYFYVQYKPLLYLSDPFPIEIPHTLSKRVKRSLYGIMANWAIMKYTRKDTDLEIRIVKAYHPLLNIDLTNLITDITKAICWYAVNEFGAIYYNIDGAIIPRKNLERYGDFLRSLGFEYGIKAEGEVAVVKSVGCWKLGDKETANFKDRHFFISNTNLTPATEALAKWLIPRLQADTIKLK